MAAGPRRRRSARAIAVMTVIAVAFLAVGLIAGHFLKSPAQRQADTAPPPVTPLTDTVKKSVVTRSVPFGASLQRGIRTDVTLDSATGEDAERAVVSSLRVTEGQSVQGGSVLLEVSGRPVILLPGAMPSYRTISPGGTGPDVVQLQKALRSLHYLSGEESGFGPDTQDALVSLYGKLGYKVASTGNEEVKEARSAVASAKEAVQSRQDDVDTARIALTRARRPAAQSVPAASSSGSATSQESGTDTSQQDGIVDARRALRSAERQLGEAQDTLADASTALERAQAKAGPTLPRSEVVFVPSVPAAVASLSTAVGKEASGTAFTLVSGALVASVTGLDAASATGVKARQSAEIVTDDGARHAAVVSAVQITTASSGQDGQGQPAQTVEEQVGIVIAPSDPITAGEGTQVRVIVNTATSQAPVLNVPISAVATGARGDTSVTIVDKGTRRVVPVVTGLQGDGRVQVSGRLSEGDTVLIGDSIQPSSSPSSR